MPIDVASAPVRELEADVRGNSRTGRAVEQLIAATCVLQSGGELNVLTGMVDDEGVDLVFKRRGGDVTLDVQVKSRTSAAGMLKKGRFGADVRLATFRPRSDLYMLYAAIDAPTASILATWLVPSAVLERQGNLILGKSKRFNTSMKPTSGDKWSSFRVEPGELADAILHALDSISPDPG